MLLWQYCIPTDKTEKFIFVSLSLFLFVLYLTGCSLISISLSDSWWSAESEVKRTKLGVNRVKAWFSWKVYYGEKFSRENLTCCCGCSSGGRIKSQFNNLNDVLERYSLSGLSLNFVFLTFLIPFIRWRPVDFRVNEPEHYPVKYLPTWYVMRQQALKCSVTLEMSKWHWKLQQLLPT